MRPCPGVQIAEVFIFMSAAKATESGILIGEKTPLGAKPTEGDFTSIHAAHAAVSKALEELVESLPLADCKSSSGNPTP
jgi:hypothetical protein